MIELTDKQLDMLCEMSEIHLQWFHKYSPEAGITYEEVLKLNHQKMSDIAEGCFDCSEEMMDFIFECIIRDYKEMLEDYSDSGQSI